MSRPDDPDARLAALLDELTETRRTRGWADPEALAARHPDLAAELRELWAAALVAEELAGTPDGPTGDWGEADPGPPAFEPGARFGPCELIEELGRGGMGVVYRARQDGLGRVVALKRLLRGPEAPPRDRARFRVEAEAAARLDHPHIVPVFLVDEHQGEPFLLMKLVEGTTLAARLADGPLPPREAAALLAPVCRAVEHAHRQGILHRDLKPANILLDRSGTPHVSDFGLARRVDAGADADGGSLAGLTHSGAILGTPSYMAPEQADARRGPLGPRADVYALGAVLYQMLTGRPPFLAASPVDTLFLALEQDPVPPRILNPKVAPDLEVVALKCLQKPAELRYPDAAALAADLEAYLAGEPVSARTTTLRGLASRLLGETHHAAILENWGLLWMLHSLALVVFFSLTNGLLWLGVTSQGPYLLLLGAGMGAWAAVFWSLRRRAGPVTFVERQIAHVWGAGVLAINLTFAVEWLLGLPALALAPMFAVITGMLYFVKAGLLSGLFYLHAGTMFLAIVPMAAFPRFGPAIFGAVAAIGFFATGLKYHLQRRRADRLAAAADRATDGEWTS